MSAIRTKSGKNPGNAGVFIAIAPERFNIPETFLKNPSFILSLRNDAWEQAVKIRQGGNMGHRFRYSNYFKDAALGLAALCFLGCGDLMKTDPQESMRRAISNDSAAGVKALLDKGYPVNSQNSGGRTLLMSAVTKNSGEVIKVLLENKADLTLRDKKRQTALHLAALWSGPEIVKLLMDNGAEANPKDYLSWSPLMWAALRDRKVTSALIDGGASVNFTDANRNTPVILAAGRGHADIVELLLARGADPLMANKEGLNALTTAEKKGYTELAELLKNKTARNPL